MQAALRRAEVSAAEGEAAEAEDRRLAPVLEALKVLLLPACLRPPPVWHTSATRVSKCPPSSLHASPPQDRDAGCPAACCRVTAALALSLPRGRRPPLPPARRLWRHSSGAGKRGLAWARRPVPGRSTPRRPARQARRPRRSRQRRRLPWRRGAAPKLQQRRKGLRVGGRYAPPASTETAMSILFLLDQVEANIARLVAHAAGGALSPGARRGRARPADSRGGRGVRSRS